jgi:hypothetical protein
MPLREPDKQQYGKWTIEWLPTNCRWSVWNTKTGVSLGLHQSAIEARHAIDQNRHLLPQVNDICL